MFRIFSVVILSLCCSIICAAQTDIPSEIDSAFASGDYERVELLTLRWQQQAETLSTEARVHMNLTAGYAMIMMNREDDARAYFRKALDADPTMQLDPVRISPKFRMVFDDVKANYHREENVSLKKDLSPIIYQGAQTSSILSNLILPGSGQWREGRRVRGVVFFGAQVAAAGFLLWQLDRYHESRDAYLDEQNPERISSAYDNYNRDYQTAWAVGIVNGLIYLAAQTDLALLKKTYSEDTSISSIDCIPTSNGFVLALKFRW